MTGGENDTGLSLNGQPIVPGKETIIDTHEKTSDIRKNLLTENRGRSQLAASARTLSEKHTRPDSWDPNKPKGKSKVSFKSNFINIKTRGVSAMELILEKYKHLLGEQPKTHAQKIIHAAMEAFGTITPFGALELNEAIATFYPDFKFNDSNPSAQASTVFRSLTDKAPGLGLVEVIQKGNHKTYKLKEEVFKLGACITGRLSTDSRGTKGKPWHNDPRKFIEFLRTRAESKEAAETVMPYQKASDITQPGKKSVADELADAGLHGREISSKELAEKLGLPTNVTVTVKHEIGLSPALEKLLLKLLS